MIRFIGLNFWILGLYSIFFHSCLHHLATKDGFSCEIEVDSNINQGVYTLVDEPPEYPGGETKMLAFILEHYSLDPNFYFQASFKISIIIDSEGQIIYSNVIGKRVPEYTPADNEMLKVIEEMPKWKPGKCNGKLVPTKKNLLIRF